MGFLFTFPVQEVLRSALRALHRNWRRAILTSLSMVVGTASLVLVVVAGISGRNYTLEQIQGVGSNLIYVNYEASDSSSGKTSLADKLTASDLNAIETETPGVRGAAPVVLDYDTISIRGVSRIVTLIGTNPSYQPVRNILVLKGRFLDEYDAKFRNKVCLITDLLAAQLERDPSYHGAINLHGIRFEVIGTFRERVSTYGQSEVTDYSAVIPLSVMRFFKESDTIDHIYVSANTIDVVPQVTNEIRQLLISRHRQRTSYNVSNLTEILKAANKISLGLTLVLLVIASISLLASGIGIMNVMLITVTERTREIGIKKAVGAGRTVLLLEFLTEALLLTGIGGTAGIFLGLAAPFSVHLFAPAISIEIPPLAIILGFAVTLAVGITFGMLPALRAARLNPVDALKYE